MPSYESGVLESVVSDVVCSFGLVRCPNAHIRLVHIDEDSPRFSITISPHWMLLNDIAFLNSDTAYSRAGYEMKLSNSGCLELP